MEENQMNNDPLTWPIIGIVTFLIAIAFTEDKLKIEQEKNKTT
jgi:hypothetical protein